MTNEAITAARAAELLHRLRQKRPLVHNITNYVAMDVSANLLLALGASPAMVHALDEVEDFLAISDALVVNVGTLSSPWVGAMRLAALQAGASGKPWVLDPVGCGATRYRTQASVDLAALRPAVVRGNGSEIAALAGAGAARVKGVDSSADSGDALAPARSLAAATGAAVAITGATDYATDGTRTVAVEGGHELMPLVTALGCSLSAVTAAFAAVSDDRLEAAVAALSTFAVAGRRAGETAAGPASFRTMFLDALHALTPEDLARDAIIRSVA
jgi:hydroxyethylthiazole kinase